MGTATTPLRDWPVFTDAMQRIANPALGILAGTVVTAAIQSSAATTGMVIVLASSGAVSLEAGISIALGANIGTCVTAVLAAIGKPRAAVQAAVAHILINVIGVIIWLPMLGWFAEIIRWISPTAPTDFTVAEQLAATVPRQIANAHTLFNVVNCLAFLPLTGVLAWLVTRLVPTPSVPSDAIDELLASSPQNSDMALVQANLAQQHLFTASEALLLELSREKLTDAHQQRFERLDQQAMRLLAVVREAQRRTDDPTIIARGERLLVAGREMLTVLDVLTLNWLPVIQQARAAELSSSPATLQRMRDLLRQAVAVWAAAWQEYQDDNPVGADKEPAARQPAMQDLRRDFRSQEAKLRNHLNQRLRSDEPNRLLVFRLENQLMDSLRQIIEAARRLHKIPNLADAENTEIDKARRTASVAMTVDESSAASQQR